MKPNLIKSSLEELFEYQLLLLVNLGVKKKNLQPLRKLLPRKKVRRGENIIPVLIVPENNIFNGKVVNHLDKRYVDDVVTLPKGHYLVLDFEGGPSCLDRDPIACHNDFEKRGRTSAVVKEVVTAYNF